MACTGCRRVIPHVGQVAQVITPMWFQGLFLTDLSETIQECARKGRVDIISLLLTCLRDPARGVLHYTSSKMPNGHKLGNNVTLVPFAYSRFQLADVVKDLFEEGFQSSTTNQLAIWDALEQLVHKFEVPCIWHGLHLGTRVETECDQLVEKAHTHLIGNGTKRRLELVGGCMPACVPCTWCLIAPLSTHNCYGVAVKACALGSYTKYFAWSLKSPVVRILDESRHRAHAMRVLSGATPPGCSADFVTMSDPKLGTPLFYLFEQALSKGLKCDKKGAIRSLEDTAACLIQMNADVNATHKGDAILHIAARASGDHVHCIVDLLVKLGMSPSVCNSKGQ